MTQEEALEKIRQEYPELAEGAQKMYNSGSDLVEYLNALESFY